MFRASKLSPEDLEFCDQTYWDFGLSENEGNPSVGMAFDLSETMKRLEAFLEEMPQHAAAEWVSMDSKKTSTAIGLEAQEREWRSQALQSLPGFLRAIRKLPVACRYSPAVEVFRVLCEEFKLEDLSSLQEFCFNPSRFVRWGFYTQYALFINGFMAALQKKLRDPAIRKEVSSQRWAVEKSYRSTKSYVNMQFERCARLVVLRVDLGYKRGYRPGFEAAICDLQRFIANQRHNRLFHALMGYVVKIEYGIDHGYHFHFLLFFDGSKRSNHSDEHFGRQIGEYWQDVITPGRGRYWNSNATKKKFALLGRLGIGTIHASDDNARENLLYVVRYLCKKEQFCKPIVSPKSKLLRRGEMPKLSDIKRRRPRKSS